MRWLIQKLAKTVTIQVSPERFAFHYNGNSVSFETKVWLNEFEGLSSFEAVLGGYQEVVFGQAVKSFPTGDVRFS